jgi:methionyl-tRNA synthetase
MNVKNIMEQSPKTYYEVECRAFIQHSVPSRLPFGSTFCEVAPLSSSTPHRHYEREVFFIYSGTAEVSSEGDVRVVRPGDLVSFDPFAQHSIRNVSTTEPLQFLAFYWTDLQDTPKSAPSTTIPGTTLVFTAPPTPNGDLHLGHLSGPFLGADIYRRFLRLKGARSFLATGQDDHQSYVVRKAMREQRAAQETADDYASQIQRTLAAANIPTTYFHKPQSSTRHLELTQQAFVKLFEEGLIYEKKCNTSFCRETGAYLYEAFISGTCPHCQAPSDGNACEQCGRPNDCSDLIDPRSNLGASGVELRTATRLFFRLSAFAERLTTYLQSISLPAHLAALADTMLTEGLPDICVSHPTDHGIPVPISHFSHHRIYVWFEMAFGYLAAAEHIADTERGAESDLSKGWKAFYSEHSTSIVHFFGFDNGYFHTLLLPAIYMAYDPSIRLPQSYVVNELLSLDGKKFSTSRGHLIWARDLLSQVGSDYVRLYLARVRPETSKTNFMIQDFFSTIQSELCETWQGWLDDVIRRCNTYYNGVNPEPGSWTEEQQAYFARLRRTIDEIESSYSLGDFSPSRACVLISSLIREAIRFAHQQFPIVSASPHTPTARTAMALELLTARAVAIALAPIMPRFGERVFRDFSGNAEMSWERVFDLDSQGVVVPATPPVYLAPPEPPFGASGTDFVVTACQC